MLDAICIIISKWVRSKNIKLYEDRVNNAV